jgi:Fe-S cluster biogenesis protein NfuA
MDDAEKYEAIEKLLDDMIRPILVADGGNLELDMVKGNEVFVSFQGACGSCPSSAGGTLAGIQRAINQYVDKDLVVVPTKGYGVG